MTEYSKLRAYWINAAILLIAIHTSSIHAAGLPDTIERIKPAIVGIGTYQATRRPPAKILGTGFAVANGSLVATNAHVLPAEVDEENREFVAVFQRQGDRIRVSRARRAATDKTHDLSLLRVDGKAFRPVALAEKPSIREGQPVAFTGFPIGAVLGLRPVTHKGIVSCITPIAQPMDRSSQLNPDLIKTLRRPYDVYQLDATAYPGNSGSPLFEVDTGKVVGIVNSVLVKKTKEAVLDDPTGISYAIPVRYLRALLKKARAGASPGK